MQSTLIRFISSKFVESYLQGELYLSSLSSFWDISQGKVPYGKNLLLTRWRKSLITHRRIARIFLKE